MPNPNAVVVYVDGDDRLTRRVLARLEAAPGVATTIVDVRTDPQARERTARLACCGRIHPVVEIGGLTLTAPRPRDLDDVLAGRLPRLG